MLSFSPKQATKKLLQDLPERSRIVLVSRYGLGDKGERTLETIGKDYGITRERVRQIENAAISMVRQSKPYNELTNSWTDLVRAVETLGGIVPEHALLTAIAKDEQDRSHARFLLTVGDAVSFRRETDAFAARWVADQQLADKIEKALAKLATMVSSEKLMTDDELITTFSKLLKEQGVKTRLGDTLRRYLHLSKEIARNPLGEWGSARSSQVRIKNTRDFAYLALKKHGSPMHFTEVAKRIGELFSRDTHAATTHNELIKDKRFVLVGRGLYALTEWGYKPGVVRDVIEKVLLAEGPLTKEEIIDRVKRERYVKDATIIVNLQNGIFTKVADGKYMLAKK